MSLKEQELDKLKICIADCLNINAQSLTVDSNRSDYPEWDSLKHFEVMMKIEQEFKTRFTSEELTRAKNFKDIVALLKDKIS